MNNPNKETTKSVLALLCILIIFIITSYYTNIYLDEIEQLIGTGFIGMLIYVVLNIIEVIIAPINILPAIAIASNLWGWLLAAILTIIGWTIGAFVAFSLARIFGVPIIGRFIQLKKLHKLEKKIHSDHIFWSIVVLRIVLPADLLSYALGLFSKINTRKYILATAIGVTPLAFALAYLGSLPLESQIVGFAAVAVILITGFLVRSRIKHRHMIRTGDRMSLITWCEERIKRLKWYDLELVKGSAVFAILFLVTVWADFRNILLSIEWYWYLVLFVIFSAPLIKRMFFDKV